MNTFNSFLQEATRLTTLKIIARECKNNKMANSDTLNVIIEEFYDEYKNIDNSGKIIFNIWSNTINKTTKPRNIAGISRTWLKMFELTDKLLKALYSNENTNEVVVSSYRKVVRDKYGDDSEIYKQSIYKMGVTQARSIERKKEYEAKVSERGATRRNLKPIYDDQIYDIIDKTINSDNPIEKLIAVLLTTGSRQIEVLKISKYEEVKEVKDDDDIEYIKITGIAKDKAKQGFENKVIFRPLFGVTAKQIIDSVKFIRQNLVIPNDNRAITSKFNNRINKKVKKYFEGYDYITAHKLRYIAPQMAYLLYGKGSVENVFVQSYLGHQDGSTSRSYQAVNVQIRNLNNNVNNEEIKQLKSQINKLNIKEVQHNKIHKQLKNEITDIKNPNNGLPEYNKFKNPKIRGFNFKKLLTNLIKYLIENDIYFTQRMLRRYGYGGRVINELYKELEL